jgi:hypothetical protein
MHLKLISAGLVVAALSTAACGSGSNTSSASSPARRAHSGSRPLRIYRAKLGGSGASQGTGAAIIALHPASVVCWRFAHLRGFTGATSASIDVGVSGKPGKTVLPLSAGPRFHHQGCVRAKPLLSAAIQRNPSGYYVTIASSQYPAGAVRAQL